MRFKIDYSKLEDAEKLVEYLHSKGVDAEIHVLKEKSMSGHKIAFLALEIEVPTNG